MKKLIILTTIILLAFINTSNAKPYKISSIEENKNGGIYEIKLPFFGSSEEKYIDAIKNIQRLAISNCSKISKKTYFFLVKGSFNTVFDESGLIKVKLSSLEGFIPDFSRTMKIGSDRYRFFCGKTIEEAIDFFIKRTEVFSIESFHTSRIWGEQGHLIKYVNLSQKKFTIKNVTQSMGNKIDLSKSALKKCFGKTPNESWTACYGQSNGSTYTYEGEFGGPGEVEIVNGKKMIPIKWHGYGKQYSKTNGWTYEGRFYDNVKAGFAKLTLKNGSFYEGEFRSGEIYGEGKWTYADGKVEEGTWSNGKLIKAKQNSTKQKINISNDKISKKNSLNKCPGSKRVIKTWVNCNGAYTAVDGHFYSGDFGSRGQYEGYGILKKPNNTFVYEGNFVNNKHHGKGKAVYNNGEFFYDGEWKNGQWSGNGILETKQGFKYSGELKDGEMTGYGKVTMPNGESKTGYWEKGVLVN